MDLTPKKSPDGPLQHIATNLAQSLQTDVYFPGSSYLGDVKAELRKVMKQRYGAFFQTYNKTLRLDGWKLASTNTTILSFIHAVIHKDTRSC